MNFKIELFNDKTKDFIRQIENDYGCKIKIEYQNYGTGRHAFAAIDENGNPIIKINTSQDYSDETIKDLIIHEAYHLRLFKDGFPMFAYSDLISNKYYYNFLSNNLWDKTSHYYFYPKIKELLEHDPYARFKDEFTLIKQNLISEEFLKNDGFNKKMYILSWYQQIWVEGSRENILEYEKLVKEYHHNIGLHEGKKIVKILKESEIKTPDDLINKFIKIFNNVHDNQIIKMVEKKYQKKGNFQLSIAYFRIFTSYPSPR